MKKKKSRREKNIDRNSKIKIKKRKFNFIGREINTKLKIGRNKKNRKNQKPIEKKI